MPTPTDPQLLNSSYWTVIADLNRGESVTQVASYLVQNTWDEKDAVAFVQLIKDAIDAGRTPERPWLEPEPVISDEDFKTLETRQASVRNMKIGTVWFFGGIALSGLCLMQAAARGGPALLFIGAVFWGTYRFIVGFDAYRKLKRQQSSTAQPDDSKETA